MAVLAAARDCVRTRAALQVEALALWHQLDVSAALAEATEAERCDRFRWTRLSRFWTGW